MGFFFVFPVPIWVLAILLLMSRSRRKIDPYLHDSKEDIPLRQSSAPHHERIEPHF